MNDWQAPQQFPQGNAPGRQYGSPQYPQQPYQGQQQYGTPQGFWPPPGNWPPNSAAYGWAPPPRRRPRRALIAIAVAGVVAIAVTSAAVASSGSSLSGRPSAYSAGQFQPGEGWNSGGLTPTSPYSGGGTAGQATAAQSVGVVDINTILNYGSGQAAGTGMILTANGEVLTNNHVVSGATSISVTVVSTGKSYNATVVGTDPSDDVAVLQLSNASGLQTVKLGDSSNVAVGDAVTAVGNAGGTGGTPSAAAGTVTALNQTITATDEGGSNPETLNGLIEVNADVQPGDSGGPLYAADGTVIGMDTAASTSRAAVTNTGYAIPIAKATAIADQIEQGNASDTIHIGSTGFLGVQLQSENGFGGLGGFGGTGDVVNGAAIAGVVDNSAAARAGLQAGDIITGVDGSSISSASDLSAAISKHHAGDHITLSWVDSSGQAHSADVTLGAGPAS